jgi:hypothetical protein
MTPDHAKLHAIDLVAPVKVRVGALAMATLTILLFFHAILNTGAQIVA